MQHGSDPFEALLQQGWHIKEEVAKRHMVLFLQAQHSYAKSVHQHRNFPQAKQALIEAVHTQGTNIHKLLLATDLRKVLPPC